MIVDDLRAFVALVSHGSLSGAAKHLRLTQPAMTRRIQRLETMIGGAVLDRSVKPARVSALGVRVYERSKMILHEVDALRELGSDTHEPTGTLRIGATHSVSNATAVSAITLLKRRFSRLQIEMQTAHSAELTRKIQLGQLDAAVIVTLPSQQPEKVAGECLGTQRTFVIVSKAVPLGNRVSLRQLAGYPWVLFPEGPLRTALTREFHKRGFALNVAVSDWGIEHQLQLIASGVGIGFGSEIMVNAKGYRSKLRTIHVSDFASDVAVWLIRAPFLGQFTVPVRLFGELVKSRFENARKRPRIG
jgi:DNA-binding transcriptional LysR family regulator